MAKLTPFYLLKFCQLLLLAPTFVSGKHFQTARFGARNRFMPATVNAERPRVSPEYKVYNYTQTLDHFNFKTESYTTFQQRYVVNSKYWGGTYNSSPILVYIGEEGDIMPDVEFPGFLPTLASRLNALLVFIEHRYYGSSMPFGSKEEAYKNASTLGFFSSEQALADSAQIITDVRKNMSAENCPVIVTGASYGGMLASWFRLKYPHIAYGALASSAPILYFLGLTPENGYDSVVSQDFKSTSESCYNSVRESWFEIDRVASQPNGLVQLSQIFNTCMHTAKELKDSLELQLDSIAQNDRLQFNDTQTFCNATDGAGKLEKYVLHKVLAGFHAVYGETCTNIVDLSRSKDEGWDWQSCTEMVMPMGRGENDTMFQAQPFNLNNYTKECEHVFGVTPRPYWIPIEFGGHGIKTVLEKFGSNIIFSNGLRDPYSSGGVLQDISDTILAVYTEEGHHCLDMDTPNATDPGWLVAQREKEIKIIQGWLSKFNATGAS